MSDIILTDGNVEAYTRQQITKYLEADKKNYMNNICKGIDIGRTSIIHFMDEDNPRPMHSNNIDKIQLWLAGEGY